MTAPAKLLIRTSLREQVYAVLRDNLDAGEMRPGQKVDIDAVADRLAVSRTPVREALLRLEVEGFVTIRPRSGIVVRTLTETDIRNLYQMVGALEAAVLLTERDQVTPELVDRMRRANEAQRAALGIE